MKKKTNQTAAKKTSVHSVAKRALVKASKTAKKIAAAKPVKASPKKPLAAKKGAAAAVSATASASGGKLTFNHAMIYCKDVERAMRFYRDLMGFKLIEDFRYERTAVYARLRAPGGDGTIALHQAGPGRAFLFRARVCACTSKSAISTAFAANSSKRASTSRNCRA